MAGQTGRVEGAGEVGGESAGNVKSESLACPVARKGGVIGGAKKVVGWVGLFP